MHVDPVQHLGLARYWAAKFARRSQDFDDVVQHGTLGLLHAAARFDPARGVAFSTYASVAIRRAIIHGLKVEQPTIRVPERWIVDRRVAVTSLNRRVGDDGAELGDLIPGGADQESLVGAAEQRDRLRAALATLPRREATVLRLRHGVRDDGEAGHPMTLREVADLLRVSRERVRQLELRALSRLRRRLAG